MRFVTTSRQLLGWGSLAFGIWGLVAPKSLTSLLGDDPDVGRWLGARDAVVGVGLLGTKGPAPVALRLASDLHDAVRLRHRSPIVALGAAGFALWGAAALTGEIQATRARWPENARAHRSPADRGGSRAAGQH